MTENTPEWQKYGYYEVYIPVWNRETEEKPVNLTIDVIGNEEKVNEINKNLIEAMENYGADLSLETRHEQLFGDHLADLLDNNLIWDCYCSKYGVESSEDLEEMLNQGNGFEVYPL